jgi:hypothetical protein
MGLVNEESKQRRIIMYKNQVAIPENYFYEMSKKDYSNMHEAVIREFFQNSVDAGAKNFIICFDQENHEIMFIDDGTGMDEDTILNKLLVMGGSGKVGGETVGAFGHAKILIYFSWLEYEIRTRDIVVRGKSNMYSVEKSDLEYVNGCVSTIKVNEEDFQKIKTFSDYYFNYCNTNTNVYVVTFTGTYSYVNKKEQCLKERKLISKTKYFDIYIGTEFKDSYDNRQIYVRTNGIHMFKSYNGSLSAPIIVNARGVAYEVYNQNRDSLKQEAQLDMNNLQNILSVDSVSTVANFFNISKQESEKKTKKVIDRMELQYYTSQNVGTIPFYGCVPSKMKNTMKLKRYIRLYMFAETLLENYYNSLNKPAPKLGVVFSNEILGVVRKDENDEPVVCINLEKIGSHAPNKKLMVFHLIEVLTHEIAHVETIKRSNYYGYHNEEFVLMFHTVREFFWDFDELVKEFKKIWKSI